MKTGDSLSINIMIMYTYKNHLRLIILFLLYLIGNSHHVLKVYH